MYNLVVKEEIRVKMAKLVVFCKKHSKILMCALILGYFAVTIPLMIYFKIPCVFRHFFGISCFGCGMTRAVLSVLRLDFLAAIKYHPLVFALPYIACYILFDFKRPIHKYILISIGVLFFVNWLIRLFIPVGLAV